MSPKEERAYIRGARAFASRILTECAKELGHKDPARAAAHLMAERAAAVAALRVLCAEHGDNDWPDNLHLADVIVKHLGRYIAEDM